jgi:hypothetical protein
MSGGGRAPVRGHAAAGEAPAAGGSGSDTTRGPYPGTRMNRRDLLALLGLAALAATLAGVQMATGVAPDVLIAAPGLLLLLPLAAGRYVGEDGLVRFAREIPFRPRGAAPAPAIRPGRSPVVPRGGLLIALALARRGPPAPAAAR